MTITRGAKNSASHVSDLPVNELGIYQAHFIYMKSPKLVKKFFSSGTNFHLVFLFFICYKV